LALPHKKIGEEVKQYILKHKSENNREGMRVTAEGLTILPHNCYQPHPAEPEQYTKCSNRVFVLLKMGIMMPETC